MPSSASMVADPASAAAAEIPRSYPPAGSRHRRSRRPCSAAEFTREGGREEGQGRGMRESARRGKERVKKNLTHGPLVSCWYRVCDIGETDVTRQNILFRVL
jgi:hypothetical protein